MDFDGGRAGIGVKVGDGCKSVEGGNRWKPADGVDVLGLRNSMNLWGVLGS